MIDCADPLWRIVGRRAGAAPGVVFAVVAALREGGTRLASAELLAELLAEALGWPAEDIARVLSGLAEQGVVDTVGRLTEAWRRGPARAPEKPGASTERWRRWKDRQLQSEGANGTNGDQRSPTVVGQRQRSVGAVGVGETRENNGLRGGPTAVGGGPLLEEERREELLSEGQETRARASDAGPPAFKRKVSWATTTLQRAQSAGKLTADGAVWLWREVQAMKPDRTVPNWGLSRRANDELDRLFTLLGSGRPAEPAQKPLLLSIPGGVGPGGVGGGRPSEDAEPPEVDDAGPAELGDIGGDAIDIGDLAGDLDGPPPFQARGR